MHDSTGTDRCGGGRLAAHPTMAGAGRGVEERDAPTVGADGDLCSCPLCRTLTYLRARLAEGVSLETLAGLNGLSRSSFFRWFRASTGLSPHQWFLQARVERAKHLLLDETQPLSEIALALGFTDQAHFGRTFKRLTGTTPGAWQRLRGARPDAPRTCLVTEEHARLWN